MEGTMLHKLSTKTTELVKQKPFTIVLLSILFGIVGAFVDAVIDHLFYYEESLLEVFVPNLSSHEFYMRIMLILTLATFAFLIALLLKRLNKSEEQLKIINENLEEIVDQRTKEFGDLFSQSPFAKALISKDFEILETNNYWNKYFKNDNSLLQGANLIKNKYFTNNKIKENLLALKNELKPVKSESIYFEELDKILTLNIYPITNNKNEIVKIVCSLEDITDQLKRNESDKELEIQRITMKTIFNFIEAERARLANELHDEVGQKLMISKLHLELLKKECSIFPEKFDELIESLQSTNTDIKNIIYALYPSELTNYGLVDAIKSRINNCSKIGGFEVEFNTYGNYKPLNKEKELGIYRICQEAVSNITKHAEAKKVKLNLNFTDKLVMCIIQDNGKGFNLEELPEQNKSYGLISMKERAKILGGSLEIETSPKAGTSVYLEIPINGI